MLNSSLTKDLITFCLNSNKGRKRYHVTRLYMYKKLENLLANQDDKIDILPASNQRL